LAYQLKYNILVTGGAGYIGSVLVPDLLSEGFNVTVLDNLIYKQNSLANNFYYKNFNFIRGDVCDYNLVNELIKKNDIIIPLASIVGAPACSLSPKQSKLINYDAHINIINQTSESHLIIFPTTNSGYGVGKKEEYCDENSDLNPISEYAKNKVLIEKEFMKRGNAISFRLATVFGMSLRMRTDLLVNDFTLKAVKDRTLILFEESFRRNYIHVRDVANGMIFAIKNNKRMVGNCFNLGLSDANLTKRELAERIKLQVPDLYIHSSQIGEDKDKRDYYVSNKKIESLGWVANYSIDQGINELIRGYKSLIVNPYSNI